MEKKNVIKLSGTNYDAPKDTPYGERYFDVTLDIETIKLLQQEQSDKGRFGIVQNYLSHTKRSIQSDIDALEDEVSRYKGIILGYKVKYEEVYGANQEAVEKLFLDIEEKLSVSKKKFEGMIKELQNSLTPLKKDIEEIEKISSRIETWNVEKLVNSIKLLNELYGTNKEMLLFLMNNFKKE